MKPSNRTVSELMSTAVIYVSPHETVGDAEAEMRMADIRHLPIVDSRRHLVGILSDRDVRRVMGKRGWRQLKVGDIMTRDVQSAGPETLARDAGRLLLDAKIGALPVTSPSGEVLGIVTETDFVRLAVEALGGRVSGENRAEA